MGPSGGPWLVSFIYKSYFGVYFFFLLFFYCSFAYYILVRDELFSLEIAVKTGVEFFSFFFYFSISNAIVYSLCYIFRKHLLFLEEE